ncbi:MAG: signal peptidase II [Desulfurobacteriaceae bacterium]
MKKQVLIISIVSFFLDRLTKFLAGKYLKFKTINIISGFFSLRYAENKGAAFSILSSGNEILRKIFLLAIPIIVAGWIVYYVLTKEIENKRLRWGLGLILGGALGNLYDRIVYGKVVDFLDFYVSSYHWPTFNLADTFVFLGCVLVILSQSKTD